MKLFYNCQIQHHYFHLSFYKFGKNVPVRMKLGLLLLGLGGNSFFSKSEESSLAEFQFI